MTMSEGTEEFPTTPVPEERTVPWVRVGLVSAMVSFSLPTFLTGVEVALVTPGQRVIAALTLGSLILTVIGALCGAIGSRTRLSSYMLTHIAFGTHGAAIVNLAFAISLLGWFGVNIDLFSGAVLSLVAATFGITLPIWPVELFAGAAMTLTTLYGFRAINTLSLLLVPVLMVVTVVLISSALAVQPLNELLATVPTASISFGDAVSSVVGGVVVGAVILPDITRFIRHWSGAVYTVVLSYLLITTVVMVAGALAATAQGSDDLLNIMIVMGIGWAAFAIVIAGSWVLNSLNLYSAELSVVATAPNLGTRVTVITLGVLGTVAAFLNILDYFITFLFYLSIVFVPVAGVIAVDYLLVRRGAYHEDRLALTRKFSPFGLAAWAIGAGIALLASESLITLSGIAAIDAMVASALVYALLSRFDTQRKQHGQSNQTRVVT